MIVTKNLDKLFAIAWFFVMFVSVIDGYLLLQNREVIRAMERNPMGLALLELAGGEVWLFLALKLIGTVLACTWLLVIYRVNSKIGMAIALVLAGFQFGLLLFLHVV